MMIEITGTGMANRGAELMLASILDRLRATRSGLSFAVRPSLGSYEQRARYGLYQTFDVTRSGRLGPIIQRLFHRAYRQRFGMVVEQEIDAIVDASGFAVGDQWPAGWIDRRACEFRRFDKVGKPVILLPQAFGPFAKSDVRDASKRLLDAVSLVYARDPQSLDHLKCLLGNDERVQFAPDFTLRLGQECSVGSANLGNVAAIVPNAQMFQGERKGKREDYTRFIENAIHAAQSNGLIPVVLVFERQMDLEFCEAIADAHNIECRNIQSLLQLKAAIGEAQIVIGSRFHALLSGLSQGVPCIGTGWSHKYQELFADYQSPNWLVNLDCGLGELDALIATILASRSAHSERLMSCAEQISERVDIMWNDVEALLLRTSKGSIAA